MKINVKTTSPNVILPTRGSNGAAGYDFYSNEEFSIIINPGESAMIHTGICIEIPHGYFGAIFPRSGLATKNGLRLSNCVGVIDEDYIGECMVPIYNDSNERQVISQKSRIAQLVILPYEEIVFHKVDELSNSNRNNGGFGSTGLQ